MRRRRARTRDTEDSAIDLTPMLDVVFILLIFFLVTSTFVKETGIDVRRASAITAEPKERASILIGISEDGEVWVDRRRVDPRAVRAHIERLLAENPKGSVVIQADERSENGLLVQVLDHARLAGALDVAIAARVAGP